MTHDEKIVEAVARAMYRGVPRNKPWDLLSPEFIEQYRKIARAAITAFQAEAWQDISTAPKDGTPVLLYCPQGDGNLGSTFRVTEGSWYTDEGGTTEYRDEGGRWIGQDDRDYWEGWISFDGGFSEDTMMPTRWMPKPLPPAPKATP